MATRADFPSRQEFLDRLTEALSQGTNAPVVRELMLVAAGETDWVDDALKLFETRKRVEEKIGPGPAENIGPPFLAKWLGWTKYLLPVVLNPRMQGTVIGIVLTALLTYFTGMMGTGRKPSADNAQLISDTFAKELKTKLTKEIDEYTGSDSFKKAVKAAVDAATAGEKK